MAIEKTLAADVLPVAVSFHKVRSLEYSMDAGTSYVVISSYPTAADETTSPDPSPVTFGATITGCPDNDADAFPWVEAQLIQAIPDDATAAANEALPGGTFRYLLAGGTIV